MLFISQPEGDECPALPLDKYNPRILSIQFTGDFVGLKSSQYLVAEREIYFPAGNRTSIILIAAILLCYSIFSKMVYSVLTQLQYIRFVATGFGFYKTIFRPIVIFRHRASCILGQAFHYCPENVFYIFNHQIYFII